MRFAVIFLVMQLLPDFSAQDEPRKELKKAIGEVRSQKSFNVKYNAKIEIPNSDPMVIEGTSIWIKPGILYVDYKASGGDQKRIIRVGDKVWIYHEFLEDWVTAEEMGNKGAGKGVQNPEEVLGVIQKHAENVKAGRGEKVGKRDCKGYDVKMTGSEIENIMKEQANQSTFDWKKSKATATVLVDKTDGLIYKFSSVADLQSTDPQVKGTVRYTAKVEVTGYGGATSYTFKDPAGKDIAVPDFIRKAIADLKKAKPDKK